MHLPFFLLLASFYSTAGFFAFLSIEPTAIPTIIAFVISMLFFWWVYRGFVNFIKSANKQEIENLQNQIDELKKLDAQK